ETGNANTIPDWFYQRVWQRREKWGRLRPHSSRLVFVDGPGLGAGLCDASSIRVEAGTAFAKLGPQHYRIDPREPEHYIGLLDSLQADGRRAGEIIHAWTFEKYAGEVKSVDALNRA